LSLKKTIHELQKEFGRKDAARERLLEATRTATRLSKQAIMEIHQARLGQAEKILRKAGGVLDEVRGFCRDHPDLEHSGALSNAYQEYVEAQVLLNLCRKGAFLNPREVGVPSIPYVLGLADVIGELRRRAIDALRLNDLQKAEKSLSQMEQIYLGLISLESAYSLTPQLRRKCDVARHLIEATRGDVAVETRRSQLEKAIVRLEKAIHRRSKTGRIAPKEDTHKSN